MHSYIERDDRGPRIGYLDAYNGGVELAELRRGGELCNNITTHSPTPYKPCGQYIYL